MIVSGLSSITVNPFITVDLRETSASFWQSDEKLFHVLFVYDPSLLDLESIAHPLSKRGNDITHKIFN